MTQVTFPQHSGQSTYLGSVPKEGPKALPKELDWSLSDSYEFDMLQIKQSGGMSGIQTIFVDNAVNDQPISFSASVIDQVITLAAGYQGYFPILVTDQLKLTFSSTGTVSSNIIFLNQAMAVGFWPANVAAGAVVVPEPLQVDTINNEGTVTDHSSTITVGGTAQQLAPANSVRQKVIVQNIDAAEDLWVRDDGTAAAVGAAGSWQIYAGGSFVTTSETSISVVATTLGHKFTAKEYS